MTEYPYVLTPLAKRVPGSQRYVQMSQLILDSMEMCRMYGELNDPIDQMGRFKDQQEAREAGDEETWTADYEFVEAMEYGMPPQSGSGIGIDRWVKVLTDAENLRETIAYPLMKPRDADRSVSRDTSAASKLQQDFSEMLGEFDIKPEQIEIPAIEGDDYLSMTDEFKSQYPTASAGYVVIEGAEVEKDNENLMKLTNKIIKSLRGLTKSEIDNSSNIESYRDMYRSMGVDWHSRRPSPEALLRRISHGKDLYKVNEVVDAYNLAVITQQVSVGVFDMDNMKFPVELGISDGSHKIDILGGGVKDVEEGEVCYFDQNAPYNLDYNYRDSERTKITADSTNLIINAEGVGEIAPEQVRYALQLAAALVTRFSGGEIKQAGLVTASVSPESKESKSNSRSDSATRSDSDSQSKKSEYAYNDKKITVVVADDLDSGIAMNTVGHLTTTIGVKADDIMGRESYIDTSGDRHEGVPRYPVIILKATKAEIKELVEKTRGSDLLMVDYPSEIYTTRTDDDLSEAIESKKDEDIEYFGVAFCGEREQVEELTKDFSLYR
jgi:DNA/RNA-binding domain of Phe-tRNA-synthetase-like protein